MLFRSFSRCRAWAPGAWAAVAVAHGLSSRGSQAPERRPSSCCAWAPRHVGSSQTTARTRVPCIGRQIPNHCTTREVPVYLFIYGCVGSSFLCEGFLYLRQAGGHSSSRCVGPSLLWPLLLHSTGSRRAGSVIVAHGPSCSAACGILPDQGSNPCPIHRQADSQPLRHQGSPPSTTY